MSFICQRRHLLLALFFLLSVGLALMSCTDNPNAFSSSGSPKDEAEKFLADAEKRLLDLNIKAGRAVQLFKSHRDGIADGDQRRDFIYVDDIVRVIVWLLATPSVSGVFNVGTGQARSFKDMIGAAYQSLGTPPNIQYIDMPEQIRGSYQYFTQATVERLRRAGYNGGFTPLEAAVDAYVKDFLDRPDRYR